MFASFAAFAAVSLLAADATPPLAPLPRPQAASVALARFPAPARPAEPSRMDSAGASCRRHTNSVELGLAGEAPAAYWRYGTRRDTERFAE